MTTEEGKVEKVPKKTDLKREEVAESCSEQSYLKNIQEHFFIVNIGRVLSDPRTCWVRFYRGLPDSSRFLGTLALSPLIKICKLQNDTIAKQGVFFSHKSGGYLYIISENTKFS